MSIGQKQDYINTKNGVAVIDFWRFWYYLKEKDSRDILLSRQGLLDIFYGRHQNFVNVVMENKKNSKLHFWIINMDNCNHIYEKSFHIPILNIRDSLLSHLCS